MEHLLELTRIIDGALKCDRAKVAAYVEQLTRKLRDSGDIQAADRLQKVVDQVKVSEVAMASMSLTPRLPVDQESRLSLADEEVVRSASVRIVLEPAVDKRVAEFVQFTNAADRLLASRVGIAPSMVIYGPPGVGKTELARYIAGQLELPLLTSRSDSLISSFLGSTAKNLRLLFEHARSRPCVLFLDELDALAKLRDDHHEMGELKRVVVSLLQNIDALNNQTVLLGATNHHHLLDPAIWRRFAYRLELHLPSLEVRQQRFELFLGEYRGDQDIRTLAAVAETLSGADIRHVCEGAIRLSVLNGQAYVSEADILRGIMRSRLGEVFDFTSTEAPQIKAVHDLHPELFTCRRLAGVFDTSERTISRRLKESGVNSHARRRTKTAN